MRFNPIGRQSKRQRKLLKDQLSRIVPYDRLEPRPMWSLVKEPGQRTSRPPSRFRRR